MRDYAKEVGYKLVCAYEMPSNNFLLKFAIGGSDREYGDISVGKGGFEVLRLTPGAGERLSKAFLGYEANVNINFDPVQFYNCTQIHRDEYIITDPVIDELHH